MGGGDRNKYGLGGVQLPRDPFSKTTINCCARMSGLTPFDLVWPNAAGSSCPAETCGDWTGTCVTSPIYLGDDNFCGDTCNETSCCREGKTVCRIPASGVRDVAKCTASDAVGFPPIPGGGGMKITFTSAWVPPKIAIFVQHLD